MGDIDEGDAHGLLDALKFVLHVFAPPHIQRPQRLIQQQHLGTVHQGAGNGHPLLLSTGQGRHRALLKPLQVDDIQHLHDPLLDLLLSELDFLTTDDLSLLVPLLLRLGDAQAEGDVFKDIQVGKQSVSLKYCIDGPFVRRDSIDPHTVKKYVASGGRLETTDNAQSGGLAASTGTEQCEELLVMDIQRNVIEHDLVVKRHGAVHQADQLLGHVSSPISFQLTACQLPRSHSRRCPQQRDSWRSRRGFTDSEIHYIRLPIKCQWILSKISVKSPRRKTGKARPEQGKLGVRRSEGRSRRTGGDHREKPGKYSVTKSTCSTWNCCPSRGASAPASVVKQNSSR